MVRRRNGDMAPKPVAGSALSLSQGRRVQTGMKKNALLLASIVTGLVTTIAHMTILGLSLM